jgi:hypothetical protein
MTPFLSSLDSTTDMNASIFWSQGSMDMSVLNDLAMISDVTTTSSEDDGGEDGLDTTLEAVTHDDATTMTRTETKTDDDELGDFLWGALAGLDSTVHDLDDLCRD